jgi:hypothetical protein
MASDSYLTKKITKLSILWWNTSVTVAFCMQDDSTPNHPVQKPNLIGLNGPP